MTLLIATSDHLLIQMAALELFDLVCTLNTSHSLPFVVPPSPGLTYRLLLSSNAMVVSRISGILFK